MVELVGANRRAAIARNLSSHHTISPFAFRDPHETIDGGPLSTNLMWDKRVVRGNTYAAQVLPLVCQATHLR